MDVCTRVSYRSPVFLFQPTYNLSSPPSANGPGPLVIPYYTWSEKVVFYFVPVLYVLAPVFCFHDSEVIMLLRYESPFVTLSADIAWNFCIMFCIKLPNRHLIKRRNWKTTFSQNLRHVKSSCYFGCKYLIIATLSASLK